MRRNYGFYLHPLTMGFDTENPPEYDDSDQLVNDYKAGYRDADGAVVEPGWMEPND